MKKIVSISSIVFMFLIFHSCYNDKEQLLVPPKTDTTNCLSYSFINNVNPIIQSTCANGSGCHGSGSTNGPGALTTYSEIQNASAQIQASILAGRMPLGSSLPTNEIRIITCWIKNGMMNN